MSNRTSPTDAVAAYPAAVDQTQSMTVTISPSLSSSSSASSSPESEPQEPGSRPTSRRMRMERPNVGARQKSQSNIIPKDRDPYQRDRPHYPPEDARSMSPRRSSQDLEALGDIARRSLKDQARTLQSSLAALAERIDEVKSDHDKLESENKFLQDYIGGLTRTMSKDGIGRTTTTTNKRQK